MKRRRPHSEATLQKLIKALQPHIPHYLQGLALSDDKQEQALTPPLCCELEEANGTISVKSPCAYAHGFLPF